MPANHRAFGQAFDMSNVDAGLQHYSCANCFTVRLHRSEIAHGNDQHAGGGRGEGVRCICVLKEEEIGCMRLFPHGFMDTCFWRDELVCQFCVKGGVFQFFRHRVDS